MIFDPDADTLVSTCRRCGEQARNCRCITPPGPEQPDGPTRCDDTCPHCGLPDALCPTEGCGQIIS